jgi:hypothetical protein
MDRSNEINLVILIQLTAHAAAATEDSKVSEQKLIKHQVAAVDVVIVVYLH